MADTQHTTPDFETRIRAGIAIGLLGSIVIMMGYVLYMYGHILAVLTLVLGWLTGTANFLLSPYFGSPTAAKKADGNQPITGDQPNITVNNTPKDSTDPMV